MATIKKVKKAQIGKKLPLGASSASAESDYAKSDSLRNIANKMTGKDFFENARLKKPSPRIQSDSLKMEGDRKTKATGGVPKDYRLKKGGVIKKKMKMGGTMKAKDGKSFPDLNKDGKITKADILKGRGVIAKKGMKIGGKTKKCAYGCK